MINLAVLSTAHIHTKGFLTDMGKRGDCLPIAIWDDVEDRGRRFAREFSSEFVPDLEAVVGRED
ncbi:MAG: hypothetical protein PHU85_09550, partial [Phycisphaerae bacterium]|nr:hypothetical protein [Phycisphaerae bacterium]